MAAGDTSRRYATPNRQNLGDQGVLDAEIPRQPGKEPMGPPETNVIDNVDEGYDQDYYEDDFYHDEVSILRQQQEEELRANQELTH